MIDTDKQLLCWGLLISARTFPYNILSKPNTVKLPTQFRGGGGYNGFLNKYLEKESESLQDHQNIRRTCENWHASGPMDHWIKKFFGKTVVEDNRTPDTWWIASSGSDPFCCAILLWKFKMCMKNAFNVWYKHMDACNTQVIAVVDRYSSLGKQWMPTWISYFLSFKHDIMLI